MLKNYYDLNKWNEIINSQHLNNVDTFLDSISPINYIGHGGTCIAFKSENNVFKNLVIKVCLKNNNMLKNSKIFMNYSNFLINSNVKILPPIDIIYEDEYFIIYTQNECSILYSVNDLIMVKILKIIKNLFKKKIKITDLFLKNFGIFANDVYIYDYHDYDYFYSNDNYYICHICHLFNLYYNKSLFINVGIDVNTLIQYNFGRDILPNKVTIMLQDIYNYKFDKVIMSIDSFIIEIKNKIKCSYNNYQFIDIDQDGIINLKNHTQDKFLNVIKIINLYQNNNFTLVDYGCSLGGIGSSVAQLYPKSNIILNNITENELIICNKIKNDLILNNVTIENKNIYLDNNSYDICLYFAILHHILKSKTIDEIINMLLRQTNLYAIIELPFGNDILLSNVIKESDPNYINNYYFLENVDRFKDLISNYFTVIEINKINYDSNDLNRYAFLLKKNV